MAKNLKTFILILYQTSVLKPKSCYCISRYSIQISLTIVGIYRFGNIFPKDKSFKNENNIGLIDFIDIIE